MTHAHAAGERFRAGYHRALAVGCAISVAAHAIVALVDPPLQILATPGVSGSTRVVRLAPRETAFDLRPPSVDLPTASPTILRPARPIPRTEPVAGPPEVIPYDIAPLLENAGAVTALIRDRFPPSLELTETEPAVLLWLFVDRSGRVTRLQLARSSGHQSLDALAEEAALEMAFRPAFHAGRTVAVWVAQQIRFTREIEGSGGGGSGGDSGAVEGSDDRRAD